MTNDKKSSKKRGATKNGSPFKKKKIGPQSSKQNKQKISSTYVLKVQGFGNDLPYEMYMYTQGEKDAYANHYRQFVNQEMECEALTQAGFFAYFNRRSSVTTNVEMRTEEGYPRIVIMRQIPDSSASTSSTRTEGLEILRAFFTNPSYSTYPPRDITVIDVTNNEAPESMDHFIMNEDILSMMRELLDDDVLDENFYQNHAGIARAFFSGPAIPQDCFSYGYPPTAPEGRAHNPNFQYPNDNQEGNNEGE